MAFALVALPFSLGFGQHLLDGAIVLACFASFCKKRRQSIVCVIACLALALVHRWAIGTCKVANQCAMRLARYGILRSEYEF